MWSIFYLVWFLYFLFFLVLWHFSIIWFSCRTVWLRRCTCQWFSIYFVSFFIFSPWSSILLDQHSNQCLFSSTHCCISLNTVLNDFESVFSSSTFRMILTMERRLRTLIPNTGFDRCFCISHKISSFLFFHFDRCLECNTSCKHFPFLF